MNTERVGTIEDLTLPFLEFRLVADPLRQPNFLILKPAARWEYARYSAGESLDIFDAKV